MIGLFVGWKNIILILVLASFIGSIIGGGVLLILKLTRKKSEIDVENGEETKTEVDNAVDVSESKSEQDEEEWETQPGHIPFGPFLALATYITILWGDKILGWYINFLMGYSQL